MVFGFKSSSPVTLLFSSIIHQYYSSYSYLTRKSWSQLHSTSSSSSSSSLISTCLFLYTHNTQVSSYSTKKKSKKMPPKKKDTGVEKLLLGRPSNNLKMGKWDRTYFFLFFSCPFLLCYFLFYFLSYSIYLFKNN